MAVPLCSQLADIWHWGVNLEILSGIHSKIVWVCRYFLSRQSSLHVVLIYCKLGEGGGGGCTLVWACDAQTVLGWLIFFLNHITFTILFSIDLSKQLFCLGLSFACTTFFK
jgi:hypothetical protein